MLSMVINAVYSDSFYENINVQLQFPEFVLNQEIFIFICMTNTNVLDYWSFIQFDVISTILRKSVFCFKENHIKFIINRKIIKLIIYSLNSCITF